MIQFHTGHVSIMVQQLSRASAAALSTVLRTTTLSYGNMRFSGIRPAETPQPIKMKFCTIDYVGGLTRFAKNDCNRLAGGGPTHRWNITSIFVLYLTLLYLTFFFLYASTAQTAQPIYTHDSSNDAVCYKEVPFGGRAVMKLHLGVKTPQKPQILEPGCQISSQINTAE